MKTGTEWCRHGDGATVEELARLIGREAAGDERRTNLRLTGREIEDYDLVRIRHAEVEGQGVFTTPDPREHAKVLIQEHRGRVIEIVEGVCDAATGVRRTYWCDVLRHVRSLAAEAAS